MTISPDFEPTDQYLARNKIKVTSNQLESTARSIGFFGEKWHNHQAKNNHRLLSTETYSKVKNFLNDWEVNSKNRTNLKGRREIERLDKIQRKWIIARFGSVLVTLSSLVLVGSIYLSKPTDVVKDNTNPTLTHLVTHTPTAELTALPIPTDVPIPSATPDVVKESFLRTHSSEVEGKKVEVVNGNIVTIDINGNVQYLDKNDNKLKNIPISPVFNGLGKFDTFDNSYKLLYFVIPDGTSKNVGSESFKDIRESGIYIAFNKGKTNIVVDSFNPDSSSWESTINTESNITKPLNWVKPISYVFNFSPESSTTITDVIGTSNISNTEIIDTPITTSSTTNLQWFYESPSTTIPPITSEPFMPVILTDEGIQPKYEDDIKIKTGKIVFEYVLDSTKLNNESITPLTIEYKGNKYMLPIGVSWDTSPYTITYEKGTHNENVRNFRRNGYNIWTIVYSERNNDNYWSQLNSNDVNESNAVVIEGDQNEPRYYPVDTYHTTYSSRSYILNPYDYSTSNSLWGSEFTSPDGSKYTMTDIKAPGYLEFRVIYDKEKSMFILQLIQNKVDPNNPNSVFQIRIK